MMDNHLMVITSDYNYSKIPSTFISNPAEISTIMFCATSNFLRISSLCNIAIIDIETLPNIAIIIKQGSKVYVSQLRSRKRFIYAFLPVQLEIKTTSTIGQILLSLFTTTRLDVACILQFGFFLSRFLVCVAIIYLYGRS